MPGPLLATTFPLYHSQFSSQSMLYNLCSSIFKGLWLCSTAIVRRLTFSENFSDIIKYINTTSSDRRCPLDEAIPFLNMEHTYELLQWLLTIIALSNLLHRVGAVYFHMTKDEMWYKAYILIQIMEGARRSLFRNETTQLINRRMMSFEEWGLKTSRHLGRLLSYLELRRGTSNVSHLFCGWDSNTHLLSTIQNIYKAESCLVRKYILYPWPYL
jgi:hypothetical protein